MWSKIMRVSSILDCEIKPVGMRFGVKYYPGVQKTKMGYQIRVKKGEYNSFARGTTTTSWDYFETNDDGVVVKTPRGLTSTYKNKVQFTDLDKWVEGDK